MSALYSDNDILAILKKVLLIRILLCQFLCADHGPWCSGFVGRHRWAPLCQGNHQRDCRVANAETVSLRICVSHRWLVV